MGRIRIVGRFSPSYSIFCESTPGGYPISSFSSDSPHFTVCGKPSWVGPVPSNVCCIVTGPPGNYHPPVGGTGNGAASWTGVEEVNCLLHSKPMQFVFKSSCDCVLRLCFVSIGSARQPPHRTVLSSTCQFNTICTIHTILYTMHYTYCIVYYALYVLYCILCTIRAVLYTMYSMYTIEYYALYIWQAFTYRSYFSATAVTKICTLTGTS